MSRIKIELLKQIISQVDITCETKEDVVELLKQELFNTINKGNELFASSDKELEFYLSPAYNESFIKNTFRTEIDAGIDVFYYVESVLNWNDTLGNKDKKKKRTIRGWVATIKNFMRSDQQAQKLKYIKDQHVIEKEFVDFLKL